MVLEIEFDTWKALTARRASEQESYDDVLKKLLGLKSKTLPEDHPALSAGAVFKGVHFPEGSEFRAKYKGQTYLAKIRDGAWTELPTGVKRNSPSEAAHAITKTNINGWRFWLGRRPVDSDWRRIDELR